MAGFNYGGGPGDGTNWSKERGSEPSPGGGSQGHGGDRNNGGSSNNGKSQNTNELRSAGDALARAKGKKPAEFSYYYVNENGDIIGVSNTSFMSLSTKVPGEEVANFYPALSNFGPAPAHLLHDFGKNSENGANSIYNGKYSLGAQYKGNLSDARIAELKKIIADNAKWASSTQSGRRITNARQKTQLAKRELAMINLVRQEKAQLDVAIARAEAAARAQARKEAEVRARAEAEARARAEERTRAEAQAKAEKRAKAEAALKARTEERDRLLKVTQAAFSANVAETERLKAEDRTRTNALATVGLEPSYTESSPYLNNIFQVMSEATTLAFNRAAYGGMQLAGEGAGTLITDTAITAALKKAIQAGITLLTKNSVAGVIVAGFWPTEAGKGSDKVGLDAAALFTVQAELLAGQGVIQPEMKMVEMPVRGSLVEDNGHLALRLFKTGENGISKNVHIVKAERDKKTGLDIITLEPTKKYPSRTIIVNPYLWDTLKAADLMDFPQLIPGGDPLNPADYAVPPLSQQLPATPPHTGTEIKPVENIQLTTTPVAEEELRDFIYWQLNANATGVEPVYVMLSEPNPRKGIKEYVHDYHTPPKTEEIKGLGEIKRGLAKTPKQDGGGRRARWFGDKGRKVYEWDSNHGELEGYRTSDGQHIGAFDPITGEQVKPANPNRNIKKYL